MKKIKGGIEMNDKPKDLVLTKEQIVKIFQEWKNDFADE
jgi:hypothetical protein